MKARAPSAGPTTTSRSRAARRQTDWEVELGVVIGREAKYVDEASALEHVAGYCVVNDVSERHSRSTATGSG